MPNDNIVLGIEVLQKRLRFVATDLAPNVLAQEEIQFNHRLSNKNLLIEVSNVVQKCLNQFATKTVLGVAVALPGLIDSDNGKILFSSKLVTSELNLASALSGNFNNVRFEVLNDANAGAIGLRYYHKSGLEYKNIIYATLNENAQNIGYGFIINGQLYTGATGIAGESQLLWPSIESYIVSLLPAFTNTPTQLYFLKKKVCILKIYCILPKKVVHWPLQY
ncbi:MAG: ROK family protein [Bacteroidales bacterium]|nr:ROK family protein [Bacteroidales bacterium]